MTTDWGKVTWLPISPEWATDASAFQQVLNDEMELLEDEMREAFKDMMDGPRFGPDRRMLDVILAPARRRARIRATATALMPGKRPGRFVRL